MLKEVIEYDIQKNWTARQITKILLSVFIICLRICLSLAVFSLSSPSNKSKTHF